MDGLGEAHGLRKLKVYFQGFLTMVAAMTAKNISAVTSFVHATSQLYRRHVIFLHIFSFSYIRGRSVGAQMHPKRPSVNTWYVSNEFLVFNLGSSPAHLPLRLPWTELCQLLRHLASGKHCMRIWDLMTIWTHLICTVQNILAYSLLILTPASSHFPLSSFLPQLSFPLTHLIPAFSGVHKASEPAIT